MGSFTLLVPIDRYVVECCDVAVRVDRMVYPHMRKEGQECWEGPLDSYTFIRVIPQENAVPTATAFIDIAGSWRSQYLPHTAGFERDYPQLKAAMDDLELPEPDLHMPMDQWAAKVTEWVDDTVRRPDSRYRIAICRCHD